MQKNNFTDKRRLFNQYIQKNALFSSKCKCCEEVNNINSKISGEYLQRKHFNLYEVPIQKKIEDNQNQGLISDDIKIEIDNEGLEKIKRPKTEKMQYILKRPQFIMLGNGFIFNIYLILIFSFLNISKCEFSNNSTNKEWCFFNSLSNIEKMSFCKFKCWIEENIHFPLENVTLRQSIVSMNIQITEKDCDNDIGPAHLANMEKLSSFLITGYINSFNLTFLMQQTPKLKMLSISSPVLKNLYTENLEETYITSLNLYGIFDPKKWEFLKLSGKTLQSFYLSLSKRLNVPEKLFYQMPEIQFINLQIIAEKMGTNSFSNLPKLTFLSILNNYFVNPVKFQKDVFSDLPSLHTMKITNFEIESINPEEQLCSRLSGNIQSFMLETSSIAFIERCIEIWKCIECGKEGSETFQTMEFRSLLTNFKAPNIILDDILPKPSIMYFLNTTKLLLVDTYIPIITNSSLVRFPLMTHYHHHRSWRLHDRVLPLSSLGDIDKFIGNPFELLVKSKSKLIEVKISISNCDCVTYEVYNFLISFNISVSFYCRNLAADYETANTDSWINVKLFREIMRIKCLSKIRDIDLGLIVITYLCFQIISFYY